MKTQTVANQFAVFIVNMDGHVFAEVRNAETGQVTLPIFNSRRDGRDYLKLAQERCDTLNSGEVRHAH